VEDGKRAAAAIHAHLAAKAAAQPTA